MFDYCNSNYIFHSKGFVSTNDTKIIGLLKGFTIVNITLHLLFASEYIMLITIERPLEFACFVWNSVAKMTLLSRTYVHRTLSYIFNKKSK